MSVNLSKFRGCLTGCLVGDCLGAPFESEAGASLHHLTQYFAQLYDPKLRVPFKPYTDDTALTKAVAQSLIACKAFDPKDMAKKMTLEYFGDPRRGYGKAIHQVFNNLRRSKFEDPFSPAKDQFGGSGSLGNGAAMRVAPLALFENRDVSKLIELATKSSLLTHSNKLGYRGAILQALAIRQALYIDEPTFDTTAFLDETIDTMKQIEANDDDGDPLEEKTPSYVDKLETVKAFLNKSPPPSVEDVKAKLGVDVKALNSVPTALYCFLVAQKKIDGIETESVFLRCIQYAFSLGGDTDTIGSMSGAICGAHLGYESIPKELLKHCEKPDEIMKLSDELHSFDEGLFSKQATN